MCNFYICKSFSLIDFTWAGKRKVFEQNLQLNFFIIPVSAGSWQLARCVVRFPTVLNLVSVYVSKSFAELIGCMLTSRHTGDIGSDVPLYELHCELIVKLCS